MTETSAGVTYLFDTIKSLEKRSACLLEVAQFVRDLDAFPEILSKILVKAAVLAGADAGVIALADKATGEFRFVCVHYESLPPLEAAQKEKMLQVIKLKLTDGIIGEVYSSGEPKVVSDLAQSSVFRKDVADTVSYEVRNLMAVALQVDGARVGVLELLNKKGEGAFTLLDVDLAGAIANQIALVVEAHRLRREGSGKTASIEAESVKLRAEMEELERRLKEAEARQDSSSEAADKAREAQEEKLKEAGEKTKGLEEDLKRARAEKNDALKEKDEALKAAAEAAAETRDALRRDVEALHGERDDLRRRIEAADLQKAAVEKSLREALEKAEGAERDAAAVKESLSRAEERAKQLTEDLETAFRLQEKTQRKADELAKALEEKNKDARSKEHQAAMMKAFSAVSSNQPTDMVLDTLLNTVTHLLDAEAASLLLVDEETGRLYFAAATGQTKDPLKKVLLKEGEGIAGWVAKNGRVLNIPDVARDPRFSSQADKSAGFTTRSVLAVPLFAESRLIGVAEAVNKKDAHPSGEGAFSEGDAQTLVALSLYGAMTIRKSQIYWDMNELFTSTVRALADAIEAKGAGGKGRAERVRRLTLALAEEMKVPADLWRDMEMAALLHDVGKIIAPESLLHKQDELSEEEYRLLARVPLVGAEILSVVKPLRKAVTVIRHVHERWDGEGYPDRLKGEDIPPGSRVIAVAVTYEAMTSDRPYRRRLPEDVAVKEVESLRAVQLDPAAVDALVRLYRKGRLKDLLK